MTVIHNQGKQSLKRCRRRIGLPVNREPLPFARNGYIIVYVAHNETNWYAQDVNTNVRLCDRIVRMYVSNQRPKK